MTDDEDRPDDVSSMMEKLWGPREGHPDAGIGASSDEMWGRRRDGDRPGSPRVPPAAPAAGADERLNSPVPPTAPSTAGLDALRGQFETAMAQQLTSMRAELMAAAEASRAEATERAGAELARLRSELDASLSERLEQVRTEALAAAERTRAEAAERELVAGESDAAAAAADARHADWAERLEAIEMRLDGGLRRLSLAIDGLRAEAPAAEQFDAVRSELAAALAAADERVARNTESAAADVARLRSELEAALSERLEQSRAEALATLESNVEAAVRELVARQEAAAASEAVARSEIAEQEAVERLGALEARIDGELGRLAQAIDGLQAEAVTAASLEEVRGDVAGRATAGLAAVDSRVAALEEEVRAAVARPAEPVEDPAPRSLTADEVDALRAQLRDDAVAAADARIAGAETRLLARLDDIVSGVARAADGTAAGQEAIGQLDAFEAQAALRLAALEQRMEVEVTRLGQAVDDVKSAAVTGADLEAVGSDVVTQVAAGLARVRADAVAEALAAVEVPPVTPDDLATLRADTEAAVAAGLAEVRAEAGAGAGLTERLDALDGQLAAALAGVAAVAESASAAFGRLDRVDAEMTRLATSIEAGKADLAALRPELEAAVAGPVEELRADVEHRLNAMAGQAAEAKPGRGRRGARTQGVGPDDLARLAEVVDAWRIEGNEEVDALRAEVKAMSGQAASSGAIDAAVAAAEAQFADRLDGLASWVLSEATKAAEKVAANPTAVAPVRSDLRSLQEQMDAITASLAALEKRLPAARRKPASAPAPPPPAPEPPARPKPTGRKVLAAREPAEPVAPKKSTGRKVLAPREAAEPVVPKKAAGRKAPAPRASAAGGPAAPRTPSAPT